MSASEGRSPAGRDVVALTALVVSGALLAACDASGPEAERPIIGFTAPAARLQLETETALAARLNRDSVGRHFRYLTAEPHVAGSPRNEALAEYVRDRFVEYGLEDVRLRHYDVYLPYPEEVGVTMLEPRRYEATLEEDAYPEDPDSEMDVGPTYLGMSASGDVTGELVYAQSGNPEDYDWLESQGIDLPGKIAIVRYSNPYSYRGFKALTAERRGLAALLIYSDPAEDGHVRGPTFPDGPWGPESHIQRGAITYDFIVPGDPLTPGWASVEGARRLPVEEARSVPRIIAVPLSARDARPLLEALGGPETPESWRGALPIDYRAGPGPTLVNVRVRMDDGTRRITVVEGRIRGAVEPERTVVLGNHRDAWVFGAVDPSSGTATQLELARVLGGLAREGRRPRRTILLASWDAEEWHLTGSTEWGEELADSLTAGAVAYLNVDGSTSGADFGASAVASLNRLVLETVRDVTDPAIDGSVLEAWRGRERPAETAGVTDGEDPGHASVREGDLSLVANRLGSGSDYTVFLNYLGIPIVGMSFSGPYGVYHSRYDDYYWMTRFGDPGFRYMTAMSEVWGRMALRLANAQALPYDFIGYAEVAAGFLEALADQPAAGPLDPGPALAALARWKGAAERLEQRVAGLLAVSGDSEQLAVSGDSGGAGLADRLRPLNEELIQLERRFLADDGIPGRPWFRHLLYAPRPTYAAMSLPGVQEAIDEGDETRAAAQLAELERRFTDVADALERAIELVPEL